MFHLFKYSLYYESEKSVTYNVVPTQTLIPWLGLGLGFTVSCDSV